MLTDIQKLGQFYCRE